LGKIKVQKSGDGWPGRVTKEFRDGYDAMNWDHDAPPGEGAASVHPRDPDVQMTHSEHCTCGCQNPKERSN